MKELVEKLEALLLVEFRPDHIKTVVEDESTLWIHLYDGRTYSLQVAVADPGQTEWHGNKV